MAPLVVLLQNEVFLFIKYYDIKTLFADKNSERSVLNYQVEKYIIKHWSDFGKVSRRR